METRQCEPYESLIVCYASLFSTCSTLQTNVYYLLEGKPPLILFIVELPWFSLFGIRKPDILSEKYPTLAGLGVTCSPRDPRFAGSNSAEVDEFFSGRKNPEHKSSGRDFKLGVPSLRFQAR